MAEPLNTGLSAQQVLTAFDRALNDYTDTEIDALLSAKQDTISDLAEIRSGAAAGATAVQQTEFETDQARQDALEAEDRAALIDQVDGGAKNLLPIRNNSGTTNGVTFTVMDDGQIVANGTATKSDANYYGNNVNVDGSYRVSGCPSGGNFSTGYSCYWSGANIAETGSGASFTHAGTVTFRIIIRNGTTVNNLVFKPMICTAADYAISPAFVPYRPSWQEMWDMIQALQNGA